MASPPSSPAVSYSDLERWGGRAAPANDVRERRADIPNGERALARFAAWHNGARGTLYVSRSYAVFAAARARVLVPLCGVCHVRAARGVELASDDGAVFTFSLTRRDDLRCALRLISVLAQRARSGAHITPQPASAAIAITDASLQARGLEFEPRSRHRRRSSKNARRRARTAQFDHHPAHVSAPEFSLANDELIVTTQDDEDAIIPLHDVVTATTSRKISSRVYRMHHVDEDEPSSISSMDSLEFPAPRRPIITVSDVRLEEARKKLMSAKKKLSHVKQRVHVVGKSAGHKAGSIARTVAKTDVARWSLEHALDIALCIVSVLAIIIAIITLRMAEMYTLHLRLLGVSVLAMS